MTQLYFAALQTEILLFVNTAYIVSVFGVILVRIFPAFSRIRKCGKNGDQNNSEYGHFLRSETSALNLSIGIWKGILYVKSRLPEDLDPSKLTWWQLRLRVPDSPSHVIFLPYDNVTNEKNYMCNCTTPIAIKFGRVVT